MDDCSLEDFVKAASDMDLAILLYALEPYVDTAIGYPFIDEFQDRTVAIKVLIGTEYHKRKISYKQFDRGESK